MLLKKVFYYKKGHEKSLLFLKKFINLMFTMGHTLNERKNIIKNYKPFVVTKS